MKRFLLAALWVMAFPVMASHIVGGEFEILHVSGDNYRVNLILYFDELNGNPFAKDPQARARIYRKRDNLFVRDVFLPFTSETRVYYTQPECSNGEIVTSKLVYTTTIVMPPTQFNDPEGYYLVWERCCRNYTITNVISQDPAFGIYAGQTFYLEFPPVVKDGQSFINSTPRLFPPLNDYACPNRPYYVDFAGIDDDGDSLVYSLVTPMNTKTGEAEPFNGPRPRPYPDVTWRAPFGPGNVLSGAPDLKVNDDGFLTVTPTIQGLFVFAVKCEEFRDGVKIGEVRRDFQMLVVDRCPQAEAPVIKGKKAADADFTFVKTMDVSFAYPTPDEERCIKVQVSDPDAGKIDDDFQENVRIRAIPLGFKGDVSGILPDISNATLINGSTAEFDICFPECPYLQGPFQVGIVAYDDACSLPLSDTLKITVNIEPPPNSLPYFTTPNVTAVLSEGDTRTWTIQAKDDDGDPLFMGIVPLGFTFQDAGMTYTIIEQQDGLITAELTWDAYCDIYNFTQKTNFEIIVFAEDVDYCNFSNPAQMRFDLSVLLQNNNKPVIDSDLTDDPNERVVAGIKRKLFETLTFNVTGNDIDNDFIVLDVKGVGFNIQDYGVSFPTVSGNGNVSSQFHWNIACDKINLNQRKVFNFQFTVVDNVNKCRIFDADTLNVLVELEPPDNEAPSMQITSLNSIHTLSGGAMVSNLGQQIELGLFATDPDQVPSQDWLRLELIDARGTVAPEGYIFEPAEGRGSVNTTFTWNPECTIFRDGVFENEYKFTFRVYDDRCFNVKGDTVEVSITIRDIDSDPALFNPPNFITPNGDGCNDYFAMEGIDPEMCGQDDPDGFVSFPKDNCLRTFEGIRIYNRWGNQVFSSTSRDFRWYAFGEPNGVYFYFIKYSDRDYKGSVTVRY